MAAADFLDLTNSESPEFIGHAVSALVRDPEKISRSGHVLVAAQLTLD
jgi:dehydrogenase/reductase SDR family protein 1